MSYSFTSTLMEIFLWRATTAPQKMKLSGKKKNYINELKCPKEIIK